jgi:hypothetical protein
MLFWKKGLENVGGSTGVNSISILTEFEAATSLICKLQLILGPSWKLEPAIFLELNDPAFKGRVSTFAS